MGKVVTIYLSDEEAQDLKGFCDENRCTQYSALKTAVKQLLYKSLISTEDEFKDNVEAHQEDIENLREKIGVKELTEPHIEQSDLVSKIRGLKITDEQIQQEPESALTRLAKSMEKKKILTNT